MGKNELRKELLYVRDSLSESDVLFKSNAICERLKSMTDFQHIMVYLATGNECRLDEYIEFLMENNISVYVPVCVDKGIMEASLILDPETDIEIGKFGIRAPKMDCRRIVDPEILDAVIVPGVGFDHNGARLGFGGGFYDRYLPRTKNACKKIAVCFEEQFSDHIHPEEHDFPMDRIVTENDCYIFEEIK